MLKLVVPMIEFKLDDTEPGMFSCYGAAFNNVDGGGDVIEPGAFDDDVKAFAKGQPPGMFWQHNPEDPVGHWLDMGQDSKGLRMKGKLWVDSGIPHAEQAYKMLQNPGPKGFSIGYKAVKYVIDNAKGIRRLQKLKTREVSVVTFPMNEKACLLGVKSMTKRQLEEVLRDGAGLSANDAKTLLAGGYAALVGAKRDVSSELEKIAKAIHKNTQILKG